MTRKRKVNAGLYDHDRRGYRANPATMAPEDRRYAPYTTRGAEGGIAAGAAITADREYSKPSPAAAGVTGGEPSTAVLLAAMAAQMKEISSGSSRLDLAPANDQDIPYSRTSIYLSL